MIHVVVSTAVATTSHHTAHPMSAGQRGGVLIAVGLFLAVFLGSLAAAVRRMGGEPSAPAYGSFSERRSRYVPQVFAALAVLGIVMAVVGVVVVVAG